MNEFRKTGVKGDLDKIVDIVNTKFYVSLKTMVVLVLQIFLQIFHSAF